MIVLLTIDNLKMEDVCVMTDIMMKEQLKIPVLNVVINVLHVQAPQTIV